MSRGPSPSFNSTMMTPSTSISSESSNTTALSRTPRTNLRVNTDHFGGSRFRSNSAQSSATPQGYIPSPNDPHAHHQPSRSLSHAPPHVSPSYDSRRNLSSTNLPNSGSWTSTGSGTPVPVKDPSRSTNGGGVGDEAALQRIHRALENSNDEGETLDLSRQGIDRIGEAEVEMFRRGVGRDRKGVWRLALSYNALRDNSIVASFCKLHRLRYLNFKGNHFTEFPLSLTQMPSLEILDLSKNQITAFPKVPGRLANLKVLSLTHNMIYTLPSYLATFSKLKVFKVDGNPVVWPPREVLGPLIDNDQVVGRPRGASDAAAFPGPGANRSKQDQELLPWIENMKSWMRSKDEETSLVLDRSREESDVIDTDYSEEPSSATSSFAPPLPSAREDISFHPSQVTRRGSPLPTIEDEGGSPVLPPPSRPWLGHRNRSATLSDDSLARSQSPGIYSTSSSRHDRSISSGSTPPVSASTASSTHSRLPSINVPAPPSMTSLTHSRGASFTATQRLSANLTAKKSLPDLRQSHAQIIQDRKQNSNGDKEKTLGLGIASSGTAMPLNGPWGSSEMMKMPTMSAIVDQNKSLNRKGSAEFLRRQGVELGEKRNSQENPLVDESRNSYFRRLSTLPVSTISKTIPPALLKFVDAIRGILFALSQLHSSLRQYLVFAVNERVAILFARVMEPASNYMSILINALDRFDSMSRRNTPPVTAIRSLVDATKESVAVFAKVVAVLRLQLPAMKGNDVRYTRTLLLMIYGSMAEVACSWQAMSPILSDIKPMLSVDSQGIAARALSGGIKMMPTRSLTGRTPISPIPERGESHSPPSVLRSGSVPPSKSPLREVTEMPTPLPLPAITARPVKSRRQGGSFSTLDVEKGMLMGSPGGPRSGNGYELESGTVRHRPSGSGQIIIEQDDESDGEEETLMSAQPFPSKAATQNGTSSSVPVTPPEGPLLPRAIAMAPSTSQSSRRGHHPSSSSGSNTMGNGHGGPRKLSVDVRAPTPASATLLDDDLFDVIETATDIAFTVWLKLTEDLTGSSPPGSRSHAKSSSQGSSSSQIDSARMPPPFTPISSSSKPSTISSRAQSDLLQLLSVSEQVTANLRECLMGLRANPYSINTSNLSDEISAFVKTVIKVSSSVKTISTTHQFPTSLRQSLSKLTQATRECAILMQVSSLRPGTSTPAPIPSARPYTPLHYSGKNPYGPESSTEDLITPPSAGYGYVPPSAGWSNQSSTQTPGLRGLQLPSRQAALSRSRNGSHATLADLTRGNDRVGSSNDLGYQLPPSSARNTFQRSASASQSIF